MHRQAGQHGHARSFRNATGPRRISLPHSQRNWRKAIQSTGFFRNKAKSIRAAAAAIVQRARRQSAANDGGTARAARSRAQDRQRGSRATPFTKTKASWSTRTWRGFRQRLGLTKQTDPVKIEQELMKLMPRKRLDELESLAHLARPAPLLCAQTGLHELRVAPALSFRPEIHPLAARRALQRELLVLLILETFVGGLLGSLA